ncbi:hypothetical protein RHMOL_Rhmol10G0152900 [Rhododendron molle]|uniref:Uncharacterized protein n=1 Tax=Rhododendron molle TaxID=49168 RepID=A0ACC0M2R1_RHOML|nr:hypothetical protein RHMOL_Rhmol10G0152900 [Rhododendron molle]
MGRPHLIDSSRNEMSHAPPVHTSSFFLTGIDEIWKASWQFHPSLSLSLSLPSSTSLSVSLKIQSTAFLLFLSIPPRLSHRTTTLTLNPISTPPHSRSLDFAASINGLSGSSLRQFPLTRFSLPSSSSSNYLNGWISTPLPDRDREPRGVEARAAESCAGQEEEDAKASRLSKTLELGSLFGLWFLSTFTSISTTNRSLEGIWMGRKRGREKEKKTPIFLGSLLTLHSMSPNPRDFMYFLLSVKTQGGLVLITVSAVEQEDRSLVNEWTPLMDKYVEEWIGPSDPCIRIPPSLTLESIPEAEENSMGKIIMDTSLITKLPKLCLQLLEAKVTYWQLKMEKMLKTSKSFLSLGICLIHRAGVGGVSTCALANGLGKKDDKKSAVVYNRYYHMFSEEKSSILKQLNGTDVLNAMKSVESRALLSLTRPDKMNTLKALVNKSILSENVKKDIAIAPQQDKPDSYDDLVKEMGLDMRARLSERTKKPEEIAQYEKERLEQLEEERQKRMLAADDSSDEDGNAYEILARKIENDGGSEHELSSEDPESDEDDGDEEGTDEDSDEDDKTNSLKDWERSDDDNVGTNLEGDEG